VLALRAVLARGAGRPAQVAVQGPRGTDQRLYDKRRLSAEERLAIHRIRQYGTGEPEEINELEEVIEPLVIEDFEAELESEDLN
jgi:hypothetical protein